MFFLIKEGLAGFKRARLAVFITIVTITLSLGLLGMFGILVQNLADIYQRIYSKIHLDIFFDPSLNQSQISALKNEIQNIDAIQTITYVSSQDALKNFEESFGREIFTILEDNPLPPSFKVVLKSGYTEIKTINTVVSQIESFKAIDEVVYEEKIISLVNKYFLVGVIIAASIGATIFVISTLLIFNTIRLTIHARRTVIEIMRLVGATNSFIKGPFIIEGLVQGLIGSLLAMALLWITSDILRSTYLPDLIIPLQYSALLIGCGMLLGLLGSYISVGKYLKF